MYQTTSYQLRFHTPAFLGNARQQGQWRTPPIKALLRQWWRVAVARELGYSVERLRQRENLLFGTAADDGGESSRSLLRIRLGHWNEGKLRDWSSTGTAAHPEVRQPVGSDLYLGFGPLEYDRDSRSTALKNKAAIQAGDCNTLRIAAPDEHASHISTALWLMDRYGTLGGRSRNAWGSFSLQPADEAAPALRGELPHTPWQDALQRDWPHAIGSDARGALVWQTPAFDDWKKLMQALAQLKIDLRTLDAFAFTTGRDNPAIGPEPRHWLSYPVTNHSVKNWGNNARLPNSLRFKVRPAAQDPKKLVGVIFHVPCLPPPAFQPHRHAIESVWQTVHAFLDDPAQNLARIPA